MSVSKEALKAAVKSVWIRSLTEIQPDILAGLTAARNQERSPRGECAEGDKGSYCHLPRHWCTYVFYQDFAGVPLSGQSA